MTTKTVNQLDDSSLPILGTDKMLVSRDGINVTKTDISNLPFIKQDSNKNLIGTDGEIIGRTITVLTSRDLTQADNGLTLNCASGVTLTIPTGLVNFGCAIRPAAVVVECASGVTTNGDGTSKTTTSTIAAINPVSANNYDLIGV